MDRIDMAVAMNELFDALLDIRSSTPACRHQRDRVPLPVRKESSSPLLSWREKRNYRSGWFRAAPGSGATLSCWNGSCQPSSNAVRYTPRASVVGAGGEARPYISKCGTAARIPEGQQQNIFVEFFGLPVATPTAALVSDFDR